MKITWMEIIALIGIVCGILLLLYGLINIYLLLEAIE